MEFGEGSDPAAERRRNDRQIRMWARSVTRLSSEGKKTVLVMNGTLKRPLVTRNGSYSLIFDNISSPRFTWLRPGWIVEERRTIGFACRIDQYYYDPMGNLYTNRCDVEDMNREMDRYMNNIDRVFIILDD
ncbi:unnamed protein product [Cochlearia groenlandica]